MNDYELVSATTIENDAVDEKAYAHAVYLIEEALDELRADEWPLANPTPPELRP